MNFSRVGRTARAVYRACEIPGARSPYDRLSLKIYYPAVPDGGKDERNSGVVPADRSATPCPVVVLMPGINVGPEAYSWLAEHLALEGFVAVSYTMVAEELAGHVSLTPGLDLSAITPAAWGTAPSASSLAPILAALAAENTDGVLKGCIDCDRVVLAGHSGGGSVALFNANPEWFAGVRGAASYGAHAAAATMLGFEPETVLPLPGRTPLMIIGGTCDGVIAESGHRYGIENRDPTYLLRKTFEVGVSSDREDAWLVEIEGANHFSMAYPVDGATGRPFLDQPEEGDGESIRALLAWLVSEFASYCVGRNGADIEQFDDNKLITMSRRQRTAPLPATGAGDV